MFRKSGGIRKYWLKKSFFSSLFLISKAILVCKGLNILQGKKNLLSMAYGGF